MYDELLYIGQTSQVINQINYSNPTQRNGKGDVQCSALYVQFHIIFYYIVHTVYLSTYLLA